MGSNDIALCNGFYFGLKDKIKDLLMEAGHSAKFALLKANALKFDHHVMEHQCEHYSPCTASSILLPKT
jgi:hypothetical protein